MLNVNNFSDVSNLTAVLESQCSSFLSAVPLKQKTFFVVAFAFNSIIATVFNLFICYAYYRTQGLNKWNYYLILSLSIADLIIGAILSPLSAVQVSNLTYENCLVNNLGLVLVNLAATSAFTITAISYDRLRRMHGNEVNLKRAERLILYLGVPWVLPVILPITRLLHILAYTLLCLAAYIFLYSLLIFSYSKLYKQLSEESLSQPTRNPNVQKKFLKNKKCTRFISVLISTFIILTFPGLVYKICKTFHLISPSLNTHFSRNEASVLAVAQLFLQLNSSVNPVLYFLQVSKFKTAIYGLFSNRRIQPLS